MTLTDTWYYTLPGKSAGNYNWMKYSMKVIVQLFSTLRKGNTIPRWIQLPEDSTIMDLLTRIDIQTDDVGIIIRNKKDATFDTPLNDGDTLTIIPPIGGG